MILLLLSLLLHSVSSQDDFTNEDDISEENGVIVLNKNNFDLALYKYEFLLIEFYAPWCSHCKQFAPKYDKVAVKLTKKGSPVKLAKLDTDKEKELAERFKVKEIPTIKLFRQGKPISFSGIPDTDAIIQWIEKRMKPAYTELKTVDDMKEILDNEELFIVGYFDDLNSEKADILKEVAETLDDLKFFLVSEKEVVQYYQQIDGSVMVIKTSDDEREVIAMAELTKEYMLTNIRRSSLPLVNEYTQDDSGKIFGAGIDSHFLLFSHKNDIIYNSIIVLLEDLAKEFWYKMIFVHIDCGEKK